MLEIHYTCHSNSTAEADKKLDNRIMSTQRNTDRGFETSTEHPRAVIHKQILDAARERPDATIQELAAEISGASDDLVERVLDSYGDPKNDSEEGESVSEESTVEALADEEPMGGDAPAPDIEDLTEVQRETIRAIYEHPNATQRELAELLGVSAPTINDRVNSVDGFEWNSRYEFTKTIMNHDSSEPNGSPERDSEDKATLRDRIKRLETKLEADPHCPLQDPTIVHKVVHACMTAENITEEEELRIIEAVLSPGEERAPAVPHKG